MNYRISSSSLTHHYIKPLLLELETCFSALDISFYVIGATARDIMMEIHNQTSKRATFDLDVAIAISSWEQYHILEKKLLEKDEFRKDQSQKQRFVYKDDFLLDILPYGEIMKGKEKIFWPPDESFAMTVLGFAEVARDAKTVTIDDEFNVEILSLAGIFILKMVAWEERNFKNNKDADDIAFILANYLSVNEERALQYYEIIYDVENFKTFTAGAKLMAMDVHQITKKSKATRNKLLNILKKEVDEVEESALVNQIIETNHLPYEDVFEGLCVIRDALV